MNLCTHLLLFHLLFLFFLFILLGRAARRRKIKTENMCESALVVSMSLLLQPQRKGCTKFLMTRQSCSIALCLISWPFFFYFRNTKTTPSIILKTRELQQPYFARLGILLTAKVLLLHPPRQLVIFFFYYRMLGCRKPSNFCHIVTHCDVSGDEDVRDN